jgi:myo-inositol-1(or 4)-monophosphatase
MVSVEESVKLEVLIRKVGDLLIPYWPGDKNSPKGQSLVIYEKADGSKVTEADLAANDILVAGLRELFPKDALVSEEGPKDEGHQSMSRVWIVDPLDGTHSFIAGRDDFSVLVGLSVDSKVVWGAMYFPLKGIYAQASVGQGARLSDDTIGKVSDSLKIREKGIYHRYCDLKGGNLLFTEWMDSGMAFLALCRGEFDGIVMRMQSHQEWDLAAPAALVSESGGVMTDETGAPIRFNQGKIAFRYLVASNGKVHRQLLELIAASEQAV